MWWTNVCVVSVSVDVCVYVSLLQEREKVKVKVKVKWSAITWKALVAIEGRELGERVDCLFEHAFEF